MDTGIAGVKDTKSEKVEKPGTRRPQTRPGFGVSGLSVDSPLSYVSL